MIDAADHSDGSRKIIDPWDSNMFLSYLGYD